MESLPWQSADWALIQRTRRVDRLPHALLITGQEGMGKRHFAERVAASLLCKSMGDQGEPCGSCRGCDLYRAGTHPDLKILQPEEPGKAIVIDVVREFISKESLTALTGGYKILIIQPAEAMTRAAANSLLKTLEEPVERTFMMLLSAQPGKLPVTIRSRCRELRMRLPNRQIAEQWLTAETDTGDAALLLSLACGAPLRARALANPELLDLRVKLLNEFAAILEERADPVVVAAAWSKLDTVLILSWYSGWLNDCLRLKIDPSYANLINPDQRNRLQQIGKSLDFKRLFGHIDAANQALLARDSQLNPQMVMESLLLPLADRCFGNTG